MDRRCDPALDFCSDKTNPATSLPTERSIELNDEKSDTLAEVRCEQSPSCDRGNCLDGVFDRHLPPSDKREKEEMNNMILRQKNRTKSACSGLETSKEAQNLNADKMATPKCNVCLLADSKQNQADTQQGSEESKIEEEVARRPVQVSDVEETEYTSSLTPSGCKYNADGLGQPAKENSPSNMQRNLMIGAQKSSADIDVHKGLMTCDLEDRKTEGNKTNEVAGLVPEADSGEVDLPATWPLKVESSVKTEAQGARAVEIQQHEDNVKHVEEHQVTTENLDIEDLNRHEETTSERKDESRLLDHDPEDATHLLLELLKSSVPADNANSSLPDENQVSEKQPFKDILPQTFRDEPFLDVQATKPKEYPSKDALEREENPSKDNVDDGKVFSDKPLDSDIPPDRVNPGREATSLDVLKSKRSYSGLRPDLMQQSSRAEITLHFDTAKKTESSCSDENDNDRKITTLDKDDNNSGLESHSKHPELSQDTKKSCTEVFKEDSILDKVYVMADSKGRGDAGLLKDKWKLEDEGKADWGPVPELMLQPLFNLRRSMHQQLTAFPVFGPSLSRDMAEEGARLRSFLVYPGASHHSALRLANAGFFYTGEGNTLKCYSCGVTFSYSEENEGDSPYDVHCRLSSACPHIQGQEPRNVFVQDEQFQALSGLDITGGRGRWTPEVQEVVRTTRASLESMRNQLALLGIDLLPPPSISESQGNLPPEPGGSGAAALTSAAVATPVPGAQENAGEPSQPENAAESAETVPTAPGSGVLESTAQQTEGDTQSATQNTTEVGTPQPQVPPGPPALNVPEQELRYLSAVPLRPGDLRTPEPCDEYAEATALHKRYMSVDAREASFDRGWPDTHAQSPLSLALAGFFYTALDDCVRCHYCGLGLKSWDPDDLPLDEHARWRSSCGYLHALLGEGILVRILSTLARTRPPEGNAFLRDARGRRIPIASATSGPTPGPTPGAVVQVASARTARAREQPTSAQYWMTSEAVRPAREMGFTDDVIREAIEALLLTRAGIRAVTPQNVVHAVLYIRNRPQNEDREEETNENVEIVSDDDDVSSPDPVPDPTLPPTPLETVSHELPAPGGETDARGHEEDQTSGSPAAEASIAHTDPPRTAEELERENRELRDRRICKVCLDNDISIVFTPCGHLVCCAICAPALRRCPMCRRRISGFVRTLLAPMPPPRQ